MKFIDPGQTISKKSSTWTTSCYFYILYGRKSSSNWILCYTKGSILKQYGGDYFLFIIAILVSVISAYYYINIIRVIYFDSPYNATDVVSTTNTLNYMNTFNSQKSATTATTITNVHSLLIASLSMLITLFVLQPSILLN